MELTIHHGRLTRDEARFEFEISSENDEVEGVVRTVWQWGCAVRIGTPDTYLGEER